jgi:DNA-binding NtrC family response regulator
MAIRTAMIIDDDADLSQLLTHALENRKIHTLAVESMAEAAGFLGFMKPTYIFLDNNFPEGMGINFIRDIKSTDEEIKIIMMTADPAPWIEEKAMEEGANYFLRKPFSSTAIDGLLAELSLPKKAG